MCSLNQGIILSSIATIYHVIDIHQCSFVVMSGKENKELNPMRSSPYKSHLFVLCAKTALC